MKINVEQGIVKASTLIEVRHINAVCGRNNSGKSTLLRAIEQGSAKVAEYLEFSSKELLAMSIRSNVITEYGGHLQNVIRNVLEVFLPPKGARRFVELGENKKLLDEAWTAHVPDQHAVRFNLPGLNQSLQKGLVALPTKRKIVPAKRRLGDGVSITSEDKPSLDGRGIVEHLFRLGTHRTDRSGIRRLEALEQAFHQVTAGYRFEIDFADGRLSLFFRLEEGDLIAADDCGMGLQDVLIMLYACLIDDAEWLLIEEPENHLHPAMQRELLRFFSTVKTKTFFLATHSSVMLDQTYVDSVLQCEYRDGSIHVTDATSKSALLADLGYSVTDNLTADVILMVEGPHDKEAIEEFIAKLPSRPGRSIRVWLLGGDIMDKQDFETINESFDVRVLIDQEASKGSKRIRANVAAECARLNIPCKVLDRYAMENYYSPEAYLRVYPHELKARPAIAPNTKVKDEIGFDPKGCTRALARETSLAHLEETDVLRFVREAFEPRRHAA